MTDLFLEFSCLRQFPFGFWFQFVVCPVPACELVIPAWFGVTLTLQATNLVVFVAPAVWEDQRDTAFHSAVMAVLHVFV